MAELSDQYWLTIQTQFADFDNAVVLMGVPEYGGSTNHGGYPAIARIRNVNSAGRISFQARLYLANDEHCIDTWYTPQPVVPAVRVSWLVVEQGAYELSLAKFMIGKGPINRIDNVATNTDNFNKFVYPLGCTSPTEACAFDDAAAIGVVLQLQTVVYDRLLIPRGVSIQKRFSKVVLQPHDAMDSSYYEMPLFETLAYMAFDTSININCNENIGLEMRKFDSITYTKREIPFHYTYKSAPGLFGSLNSATSLADSTGLRAFDRTSRKVFLITQEDQCYDEETIHTTPEVAAAIVIGERTVKSSCLICKFAYNSVPIVKHVSNFAPTDRRLNTDFTPEQQVINYVHSTNTSAKRNGFVTGVMIVCISIVVFVVIYFASFLFKRKTKNTIMDRAFGCENRVRRSLA